MLGTRDRRRDALEKKIRVAAMELLSERRLTLRALAARVGYRASSLYSYFRSKEELIDQLAEEVCRELLARLQAVKRRESTQFLHELMRVHMDFLAEEPARIHLLDSVYFRGRLPEPMKGMIEIFRDALGDLEVQEQEGLDALRTVLMGLTHRMQISKDLAENRQVLEGIVDTLIKGWKA